MLVPVLCLQARRIRGQEQQMGTPECVVLTQLPESF